MARARFREPRQPRKTLGTSLTKGGRRVAAAAAAQAAAAGVQAAAAARAAAAAMPEAGAAAAARGEGASARLRLEAEAGEAGEAGVEVQQLQPCLAAQVIAALRLSACGAAGASAAGGGGGDNDDGDEEAESGARFELFDALGVEVALVQHGGRAFGLLSSLAPRHVLLYDPEPAMVRAIELEQARRCGGVCMRVYFLALANSAGSSKL